MRQLLSRPWARRAALVLALGLLLGFAGPFSGDPPLSPPVRYAFWIGMAAVGYAAALAAEKLVPRSAVPHPALRLGAVAVGSALPLTFVAAWAVPLVRPGHDYGPSQLPALFSAVAVVQLVVAFILLRPSNGEPGPQLGGSSTPPPPVPHPLLSRVPARLGREIVALEAEDHYVRVHTALGADLVLMRLSDAVAAMGPDAGLQVHRSWWVAHGAIGEVVRSEQRSHLRLTNGLLVPVGPSYAGAVRAVVARLAT